MKLKQKLKGVFTFLVTPFNPDNVMELYEDGLRANVRYLTAHGIHVLVPCGGTGETSSLSLEENKRIVQIVAEEKGDALLIPGILPGIKTAIEMARHSEENGAGAVLVFPPQAASEEGLYNYYRRIAGSVDIEIMPYILGSLEAALTRNPKFMESILEIQNVAAFKYESADIWTLGKLIRFSGREVAWICGPNFSARVTECYFRLGALGFTDGISNFAPQLPIALYNAATDGNWEEFRNIEQKLSEITELRNKAGSVGFIKAAMDLMKLAGGPVRPPLLPMSAVYNRPLESLVKNLGAR